MSRAALEGLHRRLNHRAYVPPDPIELLYPYDDVRDREVAGLVASGLAYGRAAQIQRSASAILDAMGSPRSYLERAPAGRLRTAFAGFRHRWTTGEQVGALLAGAKAIITREGSLGASFAAGLRAEDETVLPGATAFVDALTEAAPPGGCGSLLPLPCRGSACKRLHLFFRWMVRRDEVDPGGWEGVPPRLLVVPLDTHMHRLGRGLGLTSRRTADCRTALEMTAGLRGFAPEDPVKYDFALTRLGIRSDQSVEEFLERWGV